MPIRPLEKKGEHTFIPKLVFLIVLLCAGFILNFMVRNRMKKPQNILGAENIQKPASINLIDDVKKISGGLTTGTKRIAENVLENTTNIVGTIASKSSEIISNVIIENTIGKVVEQVKKLPINEQEKIKEQICK